MVQHCGNWQPRIHLPHNFKVSLNHFSTVHLSTKFFFVFFFVCWTFSLFFVSPLQIKILHCIQIRTTLLLEAHMCAIIYTLKGCRSAHTLVLAALKSIQHSLYRSGYSFFSEFTHVHFYHTLNSFYHRKPKIRRLCSWSFYMSASVISTGYSEGWRKLFN